MTEILLTIIIVALICYHAWYVHEASKKEHKYVQAILAKSLPELVEAEIAELPKKEEPIRDQFIPESQLSDEDFDRTILDK